MCRAFSCIVDQAAKVTWKFGVDSHTDLLAGTSYRDNTADPALMTFARVEITPNNNSYLEPDTWRLKVDQTITPHWFGERHRTAAHAAHKKWLGKLDKILVRKKIVHPFRITPPSEITKKHINMLRKWASVGDSVGESVWASVGDSVGDRVGDSVGDSVWNTVWDTVGASVWASVGDSVGASVGESVWAYTGSFFRLRKWQGVKHPKGRYPFAPCVQLWMLGLVPSFDGKTWRLHGGSKATVLFEISTEELRKGKVAA
jgi:hypothetical protein